jgi:hypothetical protein
MDDRHVPDVGCGAPPGPAGVERAGNEPALLKKNAARQFARRRQETKSVGG